MEKPNMVRCVNCGAYNQDNMYSCGTCNGTEFEQLESQTRLDRECRKLRAVNAELVDAMETLIKASPRQYVQHLRRHGQPLPAPVANAQTKE